MAKEVDVLVTEKDLKDLVDRARCHLYEAGVYRKEDEDIYRNSLKLFEKDYECELVVNDGMFTPNYPSRIIIPVKDKTASSEESRKSFQEENFEYEMNIDTAVFILLFLNIYFLFSMFMTDLQLILFVNNGFT
ncbi:uncharacterized protein LOC118195181 isoform X4 [Stegodyphus dumicola]|uniref:uncharacterized protein LOC118195181 isoform X4 n=1 Tax=Stegodyphus dumicola TaxID=202533 RepID=UPI0015B16DED|nr:uncharacterized protein LOC118195181 isoform X4 [Stegodyphus dumicola]